MSTTASGSSHSVAPGARDVVDDTGQSAAHVGFDRHDITPIALRDEWLLQGLASGGGLDDGIELLDQAVVRDADLAADLAEGWAGLVGDLALLIDRTADFAGHVWEVGEAARDFEEQREVRREPANAAFQAARARERGLDLEELGHVENARNRRFVDNGADVVGAADRRAGLELLEPPGFGRQTLAADDPRQVGKRLQGKGALAAHREGRVGREAGEYLVELKGPQDFLVHGRTDDRSGALILTVRAVGTWASHVPTPRGRLFHDGRMP